MNPTTSQSTTHTTKATDEIKVSFHMSRQLYEEIQSTLVEISSQLDMDLTMPKFVKRTVQDGWKVQAEHYRKLDSRLRRKNSEATEPMRPNSAGAAVPPPFPKASLTPVSVSKSS